SDPHDPFDALQLEMPGPGALVQLRADLVDQPVVLHVCDRLRQAEPFAVAARDERIHVEPSELDDHEVGRRWPGELDGHVRFEPQYVGTVHRTAQIDDQIRRRALELDRAGYDPARTQLPPPR